MTGRRAYFYFDYVSPNAYLAWVKLPEIMKAHGLDVTPVPVLFTGLLRAHGTTGPAEQPAKRAWMNRNIARKASLLDIPLAPPRFHPFNPLAVLRLSSLEMTSQAQWVLIDRIMRGIWTEGLHSESTDELRRLLADCGLDADQMLEQAGQPAAKSRLAGQTEEAISHGVFGIPTIRFNGELFFGFDDFTYLEMALDGRDPLKSSAQAKAWLDAKLTPSSMRREMSGRSAEREDRN